MLACDTENDARFGSAVTVQPSAVTDTRASAGAEFAANTNDGPAIRINQIAPAPQ
jgi:hypothetical protein